MLIRYVAERFLYRLGQSDYRKSYVLKGAYLLTITLEDQIYRTTKDIDFLKTGNTDREFILESIKSICDIQYPEDAVRFDTETIIIQDIREQNKYHGQRAKIKAYIGKARVPLQIDIGIGDSVHPGPVTKSIPSLLEIETASVESYPIETIIAEKLEAAVALSLLTSRMKGFYDVYIIIRTFELNFVEVATAIQQTFERRKTDIPIEMPVVFTEKVYQDSTKQKQWKAFVGKLRTENSALELSEVIEVISQFSSVFWHNSREKPILWIPAEGWRYK
ncbi:nucleotidyl transferase AbiEii/AbiGii toxin family protein [Sediminispirochaeta smaragdinae]|uniref:nucleotidyl transferase AbiEii/AbiGii toxin family protein n=1 Tax=Sediminispirochaeta smaragdinae TaxID=55206 RepID=UPI00030BF0C1|nr:nucleotidyl transferase AbiEii/AbiGii toxin family protein [Sediminispirochaeta smaragdinae]